MIGHYFVGAFRAFRNQRAVTLINLMCLALGLGAFIVAYSVVRYLQTAEQHFLNADRIYVVSTAINLSGEGPAFNTLASAEHVSKYLKEEFPELDAVARVRGMGDTAVTAGREKIYVQGIAADPAFVDMFNLSFIAGNSSTAMSQPRSVVITIGAAERLFGSAEALGKGVVIDGLTDATVTGVIEALPHSSTFDFDVMATWDVHEAYMAAVSPQGQPAREEWLAISNTTTYVMLPAEDLRSKRSSFVARLAMFSDKYVPPDQRNAFEIDFNAVALSSLRIKRLDQTLFASIGKETSITTVLVVLGSLILGLACLNYANLTTAQAVDRFKEIGTRRVMGATSGNILGQSLSQTVIHSSIAMLAAILVILAIAPIVDSALDVEIRKVAFSDKIIWLFVPILVFVVTAAGGIYVAIISASVAPIRALRSSTLASPGPSRLLVVGVQFAAASFLFILIIVMYGQTQALRSNALGVQDESVTLIGNNLNDARIDFDVYKTAHMALPGIQAISGTTLRPWTGFGVWVLSQLPSVDAPRFSVKTVGVDRDFFGTLGIQLLAGRGFEQKHVPYVPGNERERVGDPLPEAVVIDRAFAESLGINDFRRALDEIFYFPENTRRSFVVVGVAENRTFSLQSNGTVGSTYYLASRTQVPLLRISSREIPSALKGMADVWNELAPDIPLDVRFLDATFDQGYRPFRMIFHFLNGLVLLAIGIAIAGLVAMAVHEIRHRFHEIAIRKTLGANVGVIAWKLLKKFSIPVLLGNLVALPAAYLIAKIYLSIFTLRIELTVWPFLISFSATLLVAWLAVGFMTLRAARLNPATVLRYE